MFCNIQKDKTNGCINHQTYFEVDQKSKIILKWYNGNIQELKANDITKMIHSYETQISLLIQKLR